MDTNGTTIALDGSDLLSYPIVQIFALDDGHVFIRDLGDCSCIECGHDRCYEFARYACTMFGHHWDNPPLTNYLCGEHKDELLALAHQPIRNH